LAEKGYGLTLGIHSRLEKFRDEFIDRVPAGNVYVNRNIIGAVVGVQPFGGEGLSGSEQSVSVNITAQGGDPELLNLEELK